MTWRAEAAAIAISLTLLATAFAAAPDTQSDGELQRVRKEITSLRDQLGKLNEKAKTAQEQIQAYDLEIAIQTREIALAAQSRETIARRRDAIATEVVRLSEVSKHEKVVVSRRLAELYRLGGLSYWRILLSIDSRRNPLEAISMLSYLVTRDAKQIALFQSTQSKLQAQNTKLAADEIAIDKLSRDIGQRQRAIVYAKASQEKLLSDLNIKRVSSSKRLAELEEKARRLERLFNLLYSQNKGEKRDARIAEFRGALDWPVRGPLLEKFGRHRSQQFATYTMSNGVKISAPPSTAVRAVFAGTVLFAQWFKGYGNLIIVDHGERVFTLYGNTRMSTVKAGERVAAGQTIATVNQDEEGQSGYLYFEVRENNKPVDPLKWLR